MVKPSTQIEDNSESGVFPIERELVSYGHIINRQAKKIVDLEQKERGLAFELFELEKKFADERVRLINEINELNNALQTLKTENTGLTSRYNQIIAQQKNLKEEFVKLDTSYQELKETLTSTLSDKKSVVGLKGFLSKIFNY